MILVASAMPTGDCPAASGPKNTDFSNGDNRSTSRVRCRAAYLATKNIKDDRTIARVIVIAHGSR